jgi:hypothetical protein
VSGSHGLVGSALCRRLVDDGHEVVPLVRAPTDGGDGVGWDPARGSLDTEALTARGPYDAVVHLAGAGIGARRWSSAYKREILLSRTGSTSLLAGTVATLRPTPAVFVCASAVGYYGDRGDELLSEESGPGTGFLADVCRDWEGAAAAAEGVTRVVHLRSGIVLDRHGGALARQLPLFRLGLGGRLGAGEQYVSWITLTDEVRAIVRAVEDERLVGALNLCAPEPVTNAAFTRALAQALHRPAALTVPRKAIELLLGGEMAGELLFASQRARPERLEATGHTFAHPELDGALAAVLAPAA